MPRNTEFNILHLNIQALDGLFQHNRDVFGDPGVLDKKVDGRNWVQNGLPFLGAAQSLQNNPNRDWARGLLERNRTSGGSIFPLTEDFVAGWKELGIPIEFLYTLDAETFPDNIGNLLARALGEKP